MRALRVLVPWTNAVCGGSLNRLKVKEITIRYEMRASTIFPHKNQFCENKESEEATAKAQGLASQNSY